MGIKFLCPRGHKLHVKSFLAGKRGICPDCGAKFEIPSTSGGQVALLGQKKPKTPAAVQKQQTATQPILQPASAQTPPSPIPKQPSATKTQGPTTNNPAAQWYVQPPSGGQFGPAAGHVMEQWISENRVSADSLVWQEGWPEWRRAGEVFPQLAARKTAAPKTEPESLNIAPPGAADKQTPKTITPKVDVPSGKSKLRTTELRKKQGQRTGIFVGLAFLVLALLGLLIYVVFYR